MFMHILQMQLIHIVNAIIQYYTMQILISIHKIVFFIQSRTNVFFNTPTLYHVLKTGQRIKGPARREAVQLWAKVMISFPIMSPNVFYGKNREGMKERLRPPAGPLSHSQTIRGKTEGGEGGGGGEKAEKWRFDILITSPPPPRSLSTVYSIVFCAWFLYVKVAFINLTWPQ